MANKLEKFLKKQYTIPKNRRRYEALYSEDPNLENISNINFGKSEFETKPESKLLYALSNKALIQFGGDAALVWTCLSEDFDDETIERVVSHYARTQNKKRKVEASIWAAVDYGNNFNCFNKYHNLMNSFPALNRLLNKYVTKNADKFSVEQVIFNEETNGAHDYDDIILDGKKYTMFLEKHLALAIFYDNRPLARTSFSLEKDNSLLISQLQGIKPIDPESKPFQHKYVGDTWELVWVNWELFFIDAIKKIARKNGIQKLSLLSNENNHYVESKDHREVAPRIIKRTNTLVEKLNLKRDKNNNWRIKVT